MTCHRIGDIIETETMSLGLLKMLFTADLQVYSEYEEVGKADKERARGWRPQSLQE